MPFAGHGYANISAAILGPRCFGANARFQGSPRHPLNFSRCGAELSTVRCDGACETSDLSDALLLSICHPRDDLETQGDARFVLPIKKLVVQSLTIAARGSVREAVNWHSPSHCACQTGS